MITSTFIALAILGVLVTAVIRDKNIHEAPYRDILIFLALWLTFASIGDLLYVVFA